MPPKVLRATPKARARLDRAIEHALTTLRAEVSLECKHGNVYVRFQCRDYVNNVISEGQFYSLK